MDVSQNGEPNHPELYGIILDHFSIETDGFGNDPFKKQHIMIYVDINFHYDT